MLNKPLFNQLNCKVCVNVAVHQNSVNSDETSIGRQCCESIQQFEQMPAVANVVLAKMQNTLELVVQKDRENLDLTVDFANDGSERDAVFVYFREYEYFRLFEQRPVY